MLHEMIKLLSLVLSAHPGKRMGQILAEIFRGQIDLLHLPDAEFTRMLTDALKKGEHFAGPRRVIMPIGLPGSGKSTLTARIANERRVAGNSVVICSTDDFFMRGDRYEFNPGKLMEFHARNFQKFALALADARDVVIVDNTNLREEHREPYVKLARAFGYQVEMPVVGEFTDEACKTYAARNVHGVPLEGLRRMASSVQLPEEEIPAGFDTKLRREVDDADDRLLGEGGAQ